jgi:hypothetical protein
LQDDREGLTQPQWDHGLDAPEQYLQLSVAHRAGMVKKIDPQPTSHLGSPYPWDRGFQPVPGV